MNALHDCEFGIHIERARRFVKEHNWRLCHEPKNETELDNQHTIEKEKKKTMKKQTCFNNIRAIAIRCFSPPFS